MPLELLFPGCAHRWDRVVYVGPDGDVLQCVLCGATRLARSDLALLLEDELLGAPREPAR